RPRRALAPHGLARDRIRGRSRAGPGPGRRRPGPSLLRRIRLRPVRAIVRGAAAPPVLLQQSLRRLRDLPRIREPDRARPGPRHPGQGALARTGGGRALEQTTLPRAARRAQALRPAPGNPDGRAVVASRRGAPAPGAGGRRGVPRGGGLLPLARDEEIQGAGPGVPEPVPGTAAV